MSSSSSIASATSSIAAATSSSVTAKLTVSKNLKVVGIILAICSGLLIGSSFVFKKKGLLRSQAGGAAGEGVAYLKSPLWWTGMSLMILGELCNFAAYAFVEAVVVTPLGALSVVICAILSSFFLNETLTFFGWLGCSLCILGSVIIALNGPQEQSVGQIRQFEKMFLAPGFLAYGSVLIAASLTIIFYFGPKYGKKQMVWYILVCSMIGGISVSVTTGLGAAIVETAFGDNQFKFWFMYFLMGFVVITLLTEVYYLNVALALFNTAMVTPTYYVIFTFFSMITTIVLFKGLQSSASQIITLVMGFLVICVGITILQMSKIDPSHLAKLDRRSTILLQAARAPTASVEEKNLTGFEDPGMDALRGSFGTFGSIIRARSARRASQGSTRSKNRVRSTGAYDVTALSWMSDRPQGSSPVQGLPLGDTLGGLKRHQLYDSPVPRDDASSRSLPVSTHSISAPTQQHGGKRMTIKFDSKDVVHQYNRPGTGDTQATHEHRAAHGPPTTFSSLPPVQDTLVQPAQGEPSEEMLIKVDSPDPSFELVDIEEGVRQALLLPPEISQEQQHTVPSVLPILSPRSSPVASGSRRRDSPPDVQNKTPSTGTMKTFPSVTDSSPSDQVWDEDEVERQKEIARARDRFRSLGIGGKRYPRTSMEDDAEESVSLWHRRSGAVGDADPDENENEMIEQSADSSMTGPTGGIRLVQPRKADL
ncbi:hypothetical protein APHAL10511_007776 [Amanita phalloides]|nr:hypothetical protein APHAL10511_007776 [Amanita phalloides]